MKLRRTPLSRVLLLLLLVVGPLQAQALFACGMMDTVVHDECCCGEHEAAEACTGHDCDSKLDSASPCCEGSVVLGLDEDAPGKAAAVKPPGADPPIVLPASADAVLVPDPPPMPGAFSHRTPAVESGSSTWLVTLRLRI